jgi:hypothetical protein
MEEIEVEMRGIAPELTPLLVFADSIAARDRCIGGIEMFKDRNLRSDRIGSGSPLSVIAYQAPELFA